MTRTITALFDQRADAEAAENRLKPRAAWRRCFPAFVLIVFCVAPLGGPHLHARSPASPSPPDRRPRSRNLRPRPRAPRRFTGVGPEPPRASPERPRPGRGPRRVVLLGDSSSDGLRLTPRVGDGVSGLPSQRGVPEADRCVPAASPCRVP